MLLTEPVGAYSFKKYLGPRIKLQIFDLLLFFCFALFFEANIDLYLNFVKFGLSPQWTISCHII